MRIGSLFTGYGGLDLAAEEFYTAEVAWSCDIDLGASKILAHRYPDAPNLGDITAVDWSTVEPVNILTGGWPCQPFSLAGKQKGAADERALWPEVVRAVRTLRPGHVVLENVAAIATAGELARAVGDLASLGYVGQWRCVRASDVGAPHQRARLFIVATDSSNGSGLGGLPRSAQRHVPSGNGQSLGSATDTEGDAGWLGNQNSRAIGDTATDTDGDGSQSLGRQQPLGCDPDRRNSTDTAWGVYKSAIRRWEHILQRPAPPPTEPGRNGAQRLSPHFVEWMMGLPAGWVTNVPGLTRNAQLKALGNGVVPQQALAALQLMGGPT
jgi:DNA (cytosine-5)-methyltransferase 1